MHQARGLRRRTARPSPSAAQISASRRPHRQISKAPRRASKTTALNAILGLTYGASCVLGRNPWRRRDRYMTSRRRHRRAAALGANAARLRRRRASPLRARQAEGFLARTTIISVARSRTVESMVTQLLASSGDRRASACVGEPRSASTSSIASSSDSLLGAGFDASPHLVTTPESTKSACSDVMFIDRGRIVFNRHGT